MTIWSRSGASQCSGLHGGQILFSHPTQTRHLLLAHLATHLPIQSHFGLDETNCEGATTSIRLFFTWEYIPHSSLSFSIVFYSIFIEKCIQWKRTKRRTLWILGKPTWVTCTKGRCGRPMLNKFTIFYNFGLSQWTDVLRGKRKKKLKIKNIPKS